MLFSMIRYLFFSILYLNIIFPEKGFLGFQEDASFLLKKFGKQSGIAVQLGELEESETDQLLKNFTHVITVCPFENCPLSRGENQSFCFQRITQMAERSVDLRNGVSLPDKTLSWKQFVFDYVSQNPKLKHLPISLIRVNLKGGEEKILEDLLYFSYHNQCSLLISFDLSQWSSQSIEFLEKVDSFFSLSLLSQDLASYLIESPQASVFFTPKKVQKAFKKRDIPACIIGYNQPTYIKQMVKQLEKHTKDIVIIDNASDFRPLLDYYEKEYPYTLIRYPRNAGHTVWCLREMEELLGDIFLVTDPDLLFNVSLPDSFLDILYDLSNEFSATKVGFALDVFSSDIRDDALLFGNIPVKEWEQNAWNYPIYSAIYPSLELYQAEIDTTFCLFNRYAARKALYNSHIQSIRLAGDFMCRHLPWHEGYLDSWVEGEFEAYMNRNVSTNLRTP